MNIVSDDKIRAIARTGEAGMESKNHVLAAQEKDAEEPRGSGVSMTYTVSKDS